MNMDARAGLSADASRFIDLESRNEDDTLNLGRLVADYLKPGDVVSLDGSLGAGKTVLVRGLALGLRCLGAVTSPTFTLLMVHPAAPGGLALYHFDAYRLGGEDDFCASGLDEFLYGLGDGVSVVEWGSQIAGILPAGTLQIIIEVTGPETPSRRHIQISWPGNEARLADLASVLGKTNSGDEHADIGG
jgi:tRNA threonylcarbamoyladenosine biosynthesis protein TsaE